jgi:hypothetical protein
MALAAIVATGNATTFAQTPTVLRGSNSGGALSGGSSAPVVLRGTTPPPAPAGPVAATAAPCPAGYALDPSSGCIGADFASAPDDDGWLLGYPLLEPSPRSGRRFAERRVHPFGPTTAAARPFIRFAHPGSFGRQ